MRRNGAILLLVLVWCLPASAAAAAPPSIVNAPPSDIRNREATAHFSIDPEGLATTYYVEYGVTTSYGQRASLYDEKIPAGDDPVAQTEVLSVWGLKPATTYHYRVVATNSAGTTYGEDREVTTTDEPAPTVVTGVASDYAGSTVTLHGTIDPEGLPVTDCHFHYVRQGQYGRYGFTYSVGPRPEPMGIFVPCAESPAEIGSGTAPVPVHAVVSDPLAGAHQFRLEAENAYDAAVPGEASPFGAPTTVLLEAGQVTATTAIVRARVERDAESVAWYRFEYGRTDSYGRKTKKVAVPPPGIMQPAAEAELTRLRPGTEYHYRVVATNEFGTNYSGDGTFATSPAPTGAGLVAPTIVMPPPEAPPAAAPPTAAAPTVKAKAKKKVVKKSRKQRKKAKRFQQRRNKARAAR